MHVQSFRVLLVPAGEAPDFNRLESQVRAVLVDFSDIVVEPGLIPPIRWRFVDATGLPVSIDPPTRPAVPIDPPVRPAVLMAPPPRPGRHPIGSVRLRSSASDTRLRKLIDALLENGQGVVMQGDPELRSTLWAGGAPFGTRTEAHRLIEAAGLPAATETVHVVIVDQGFDAKLFPNNYSGGFKPLVGTVPGQGRSDHATAVARRVLELAPHAKLYDAPLIPFEAPGARATINSIPAFTGDAWWLWLAMQLGISWIKSHQPRDSWVLVNAWAVYDRATDRPPTHYMTDKDHFLNKIVHHVAKDLAVDTVFAAGNCGQFEPDLRCGATDRGPCRSITGANSLSSVLTVGAVRTDGTWLGYSSQGPGQTSLGLDKPDVCAPSGFAADFDARAVLSGTSGAAAVAGGVVAALRGQFPQQTVSPATLNSVLRDTARKMPEPPTRLGQGIIRAAAAADELAAACRAREVPNGPAAASGGDRAGR